MPWMLTGLGLVGIGGQIKASGSVSCPESRAWIVFAVWQTTLSCTGLGVVLPWAGAVMFYVGGSCQSNSQDPKFASRALQCGETIILLFLMGHDKEKRAWFLHLKVPFWCLSFLHFSWPISGPERRDLHITQLNVPLSVCIWKYPIIMCLRQNCSSNSCLDNQAYTKRVSIVCWRRLSMSVCFSASSDGAFCQSLMFSYNNAAKSPK